MGHGMNLWIGVFKIVAIQHSLYTRFIIVLMLGTYAPHLSFAMNHIGFG